MVIPVMAAGDNLPFLGPRPPTLDQSVYHARTQV